MGFKRGNMSKYKRATMPLNVFFSIAKKCKFNIPDVLRVTNKTGKSKPIKLQKYIDQKNCYVIGAMLGDGHIGNTQHKGREVVFSALDKPPVMSKFSDCVLNIFGLKPKKRKKGLVYYSTALGELLIMLGVPPGRKGSKIRVPRYVFELDEKNIYGFINGLFDTDGNATKHSISIASVSHRLLKDLKWLFLKLSIVSYIRQYKPNPIIEGRRVNAKSLYTITVSGENQLNQLLRKCDFDKSKCEILIKSLKNIKRSGTRFKEILPIANLLRDTYKEHRKNGGRRLDEVVNAYSMGMLSYNSLKKLLNKLKSNKVQKIIELMNLPIRWVRVKTIKRNESEKWVYDLTIEDEHNFIGNWLINHNTVCNDLKSDRLNLKDFTFITFDEAHRAVKNYAYTYIAKKYMLQAAHPLILGLTASPGSSREKIEEITQNLFIGAVEIRSETDGDVQPYVQDIQREWIYVDFPEKYQHVKALLEEVLKDDVDWLYKKHYIPIPKPTKKMLLNVQQRVSASYGRARKNFGAFWAMIRSAEAIKIEHAVELLETQGINFLYDYLQKMMASGKRTDKRLFKNKYVIEAMQLIEDLHKTGEEHPKMRKLSYIVKDILAKNEKAKIMIFANYRFTVDKIKDLLEKDGIKSEILIGQTIKDGKGMTQQQQIEIIKRFKSEEFSVLICSSIGEEGLDIEEVSAVIFFESVPTEIRKIQRSGRTGRTMPGKVIFLITKGTRDEAYYYSALRKEKRMKGILYEMKNGRGLRKKKSLFDWVK
jgi:ERCC4-related helicase